MGKKTKIDWADATWNPVTGCLHGCEYCYARGIARRFGAHGKNLLDPVGNSVAYIDGIKGIRELDNQLSVVKYDGYVWTSTKVVPMPYPYDFDPTLHRYRLDIPARWTRPRTIFVCSMADLFGEWVPDDWIIEVLNACRKAPWHRYLFLTKNPFRYDCLEDEGIITDQDTNFWLGTTTTDITRDYLHYNRVLHTFQSCEPMLKPWPPAGEPNRKYEKEWPEWIIFGAETGNRKGKVIPEKAWVDNAVVMCRKIGAKVFMKESLRDIMGDDFIQEFPWEAQRHGEGD